MSDAHDESATCDNCGADADKEPRVLCDDCESTDAIYTQAQMDEATRKAAADERSEILIQIVQDRINPASTGSDSYYYACCASDIFDEIKARAKGDV